jgi:shikimate kinase
LTSRNSRRHLFLIGYRGSGKTTVGRLLSSALSLPWLDLDHQIELSLGEPISGFFKNHGEEAFRDVESGCLKACIESEASVISLGGGAILRVVNRRILRESGWTVWLRCSHATLAERIGKDEGAGNVRPSLTGKDVVSEIEQVMRVREPLYSDAADWSIEVDDYSPEEVASQIGKWYRTLMT